MNYDEDQGQIDEEQIGRFEDLLTLQSDIIRNTTKISAEEKRKFISNNVSCYVALMWGALESFREFLQKTDEDKLVSMFARDGKNKSMEQKIRSIAENAQRIVHQVVPLSVLAYMNEHLGNPRLARSFRTLASREESRTIRMFYRILIFAQNPKEGIKEISKMITGDSPQAEDFIIAGFLRWHCYHTKIDEATLDRIVAILDEIRKKYARVIKDKKLTKGYLVDSFKTDFKKQIMLKHRT